MAQNISSLLQMAQQQYGNQGTDASTQADTAESSSVDVLKGMMARGSAAQELAQQRNLENQKGLERLFAEAGVGPQGLLNTLGIGLGNALGQRSAEKNPDGEMQRAIAIDNLTEQAASSNDPNQLLEFGRQLIALREYKAGGQMIALAGQLQQNSRAERQINLSEEQFNLAKDSRFTNLVGKIYAEGLNSFEESQAMARQILGLDPAPPPSPLPNEVIPDPAPPPIIDLLKNLPVGSSVPIAGDTYVITKDGPVVQEKPINGRGARGRRSRAQGGK
jgi:hypothetical protein